MPAPRRSLHVHHYQLRHALCPFLPVGARYGRTALPQPQGPSLPGDRKARITVLSPGLLFRGPNSFGEVSCMSQLWIQIGVALQDFLGRGSPGRGLLWEQGSPGGQSPPEVQLT